MRLEFSGIVMETRGDRTARDKRRGPNSVVIEYIGADGFEYRKRFNSYSWPIEFPKSGENSEITRIAQAMAANPQ